MPKKSLAPSDHELLVDIHRHVMGELATKKDVARSQKTIISRIVKATTAEPEQRGPTSSVRQSQFNAVRRVLYEAYQKGLSMSLHDACLKAWEPLNDGYPSPKALYQYCHEHEELLD